MSIKAVTKYVASNGVAYDTIDEAKMVDARFSARETILEALKKYSPGGHDLGSLATNLTQNSSRLVVIRDALNKALDKMRRMEAAKKPS